ncbi:hypothetical protein BDP27DRAFT_1325233 [Rhodocollybia butyracea]|uniref:trimethyllysine dioxygenase n=1 Tax=Rhodocollybia butyracea TaxID=206335 RepID=A0A9P5PUR6_9AGAR|nr:hypothetical protein BDP27DRAFT_1325233 [Rhodocollybia butyracea]
MGYQNLVKIVGNFPVFSLNYFLPTLVIYSFSHHIWLRDHCRCPSCFHPKTNQRLLNTFEIPSHIQPLSVQSTPEGLKVLWPVHVGSSHEQDESSHSSPSSPAAMAEHESLYPWNWLKRNSYDPKMERNDADFPEEKKILWNSRIAQSPPSVAYTDVINSGENEKGLYKWLENIDQFGFSFVTDVPPNASATEKLVRRISFIRETHYGAFWEFTSDLAKGDTAYTNIPLGAHTDNTYFTDPCGLQLFHLLEHTSSSDPHASDSESSPIELSNTVSTPDETSPRPEAEFFTASTTPNPNSNPSPATTPPSPKAISSSHSLGGTTLLVDGFYVASILRQLHPDAYDLLSSVKVPAHAAGERDTAGIFSTDEGHPILTHDTSGNLIQVRWNNDDRSAVTSLPSLPGSGMTATMEEWYNALRTFHTLLSSPDSEFWVQLEPGTAVIVDNHRVLHGRSGFMGRRRMCGAYVGKDEWKAKLRGLREKHRVEGGGQGDESEVWSRYY